MPNFLKKCKNFLLVISSKLLVWRWRRTLVISMRRHKSLEVLLIVDWLVCHELSLHYWMLQRLSWVGVWVRKSSYLWTPVTSLWLVHCLWWLRTVHIRRISVDVITLWYWICWLHCMALILLWRRWYVSLGTCGGWVTWHTYSWLLWRQVSTWRRCICIRVA